MNGYDEETTARVIVVLKSLGVPEAYWDGAVDYIETGHDEDVWEETNYVPEVHVLSDRAYTIYRNVDNPQWWVIKS